MKKCVDMLLQINSFLNNKDLHKQSTNPAMNTHPSLFSMMQLARGLQDPC